MSVIVKGMRMPENCDVCKFLKRYGNYAILCTACERSISMFRTDNLTKREEWCPLEEVKSL